MNRVWLLLFVAVICPSAALQAAPVADSLTSVPAAESVIRWVGRTAVSDDGSVSFNWSGTYCDIRFRGTVCRMRGGDTGKVWFNVFADGSREARVVMLTGADTVVTLFEGMPGEHLLRLQRRTEGNQGRSTVAEFQFAAGTKLLPVENVPSRHIEVVGDSYTCGYGTESFSKEDPWDPFTEDCDDAYGCIIARYFGADYNLVSHSGIGIVRNYGDKHRTSEVTMKDRYSDTFDEDTSVKWNFSASPYRPDVVIVNLGTNDWSVGTHPTMEELASGFMTLIGKIRAAYGDEIPIVCVMYEWAFPYYSQAMEMGGVTIAPVVSDRYRNENTDLGASWHPNMFGQQKMASLLIPYVSTVTGWDMQ